MRNPNRVHLGITVALLASVVTFGALVGFGVVQIGLRNREQSDAAPPTPPEPETKVREAPGRIEAMKDVGKMIEELGEREFFKGGIVQAWAYHWSGGPFAVSVESKVGGSEKVLATYPGNSVWRMIMEQDAVVGDRHQTAGPRGEVRKSAYIVLARLKEKRALRLYLSIKPEADSPDGSGFFGAWDVPLPAAPAAKAPVVREKQAPASPGSLESGLNTAWPMQLGQESPLLHWQWFSGDPNASGEDEFVLKLRSLRPEDLEESSPAGATVK